MNSNSEFAAHNDVITRHLGSILPPGQPMASADSKHRTLTASGADDLSAEMAEALQHLLLQYVALLESSEHGGWSLDEDTTVRRVCAVLSKRAT